jgi:hypothetical protein
MSLNGFPIGTRKRRFEEERERIKIRKIRGKRAVRACTAQEETYFSHMPLIEYGTTITDCRR